MDDYILNRLRANAAHLLNLSENEKLLPHAGLKGRFRELLVDNLLAPWLPPYMSCGTGMIIAANNSAFRTSTQDDVIIYDKSLVPPVMSSLGHAPEGVFLYNSVLARIEVKSVITRTDIKDFVKSSIEVSKLLHSVTRPDVPTFTGCFNLLFAYDSDAAGEKDQDYQIKRITQVMNEQGCHPLSGIVSMVCIPKYGLWKTSPDSQGAPRWERLAGNDPLNNIAWFIGCTSNMCYIGHAQRQGRDPSVGLEGGIGMYLRGDVYQNVHLEKLN